MSKESWKLEKDLCRCCHAEGTYKSVYDRYFSQNIEEYISSDIQEMKNTDSATEVVFSDMLRECFGVELAPVTGPLSNTVCKICDACILRLRDATEFKQQVRDCERRFREQYLRRLETVSEYEVDVKLETPDLESNDYDNVYTKGEPRDDQATSILAHDGRKAVESECNNYLEIQVKDEDVDISSESKQNAKLTNAKVSISKLRKKTAPASSKVTKTKQTIIAKVTRMKTVAPLPKVKKKVKLNISKMTVKKTAAHSSNAATPNNQTDSSNLLASNSDIVDMWNEPPHVQLTRDIDYKRMGNKRQCCRCDYICTSLRGIKNHVNTIHLDIPRFSCPICPEKFHTLSPFVKHKLDKHSIDDRYKCYACDKTFNTNIPMQQHMNSFHMLGKKHKCDVCEYESYSARSTYRHKRVHDNEKNFHCKFCRKSFKRKTNLQLHEKIHTGDKRQVCKECGQAFVQKASLNYHMTKYHPGVNF